VASGFIPINFNKEQKSERPGIVGRISIAHPPIRLVDALRLSTLQLTGFRNVDLM
jgi:hypothetical protein